MIAYMKILFATIEEFMHSSKSLESYCHTSLLFPFATPRNKVSNLLIFMIESRLIAVELEDKIEETINQPCQYSGCL